MKLLILSEEENISMIRNSLRASSLFYGIDNKVECFTEIIDSFSPELFDVVVTDKYSFEFAADFYRYSSDFSNLYLWIAGIIVPTADKELLDNELKKQYSMKNWQAVKEINRIKMELNYITRKEYLDSFPSQLQIESTSFCNAQCIMCNHYYGANYGSMDMNEKIIDKLEELFPYIRTVIMHGNGEPFLSRMFERCADKYSQYGIKLTTNTNLSILNDSHIEIINRSFDNIRVSCDGCTKEIYEGIRENLSFEVFEENLTKLRDKCPDVQKIMVSVIMRQNIEQLPELVSFAANYGFDEILFLDLSPNLLLDNEKDHVSRFRYLAAEQSRLALAKGEKLGIKVTFPDTINILFDDPVKCEEDRKKIHETPFFRTAEEKQIICKNAYSIIGGGYRFTENMNECRWDDNNCPCSGICEWVVDKTYIDLKGDVFVCCINTSYRVGNIFEVSSFKEIWNSETYRSIRKIFYEGKLPAFCNNCQFILNHSLEKLNVHQLDDTFFKRSQISRKYREHFENKI